MSKKYESTAKEIYLCVKLVVKRNGQKKSVRDVKLPMRKTSSDGKNAKVLYFIKQEKENPVIG